MVGFLIATLVCVVSVSRALRIDDPDVRWGLVALLVTAGGWAAMHIGYVASPGEASKYAFFVAGLVIGFAAVGPWLYFCSAYSGRTLHRDTRVRAAAVVVYVAIVLVKVTNPWHEWYFTATMKTEPFPHLLIDHQPLHWVIMGLAYALAFVGIFMLFELFVRVDYRTSPLVVLVGLTGVPVIFDVLGALSPYLLEITYSPLGVAAFAAGVLYLYYERFQAISLTGDTDEPVIVLDDADAIRDINRSARSLFPELDRGRTLAEQLPQLAAILDEEAPVWEYDRPAMTRYYQLVETPFSADRTRRGRMVTLRDVTEREQYRRELERKNARLEEFANFVSHDLRNPLSVAKGRLDLAREELDNEHLNAVDSAHERMETLIEDLLDLARAGSQIDEIEDVELATVIDACWANVKHESATIDADVAITIRADRTRLQQLCENLFRNAIEHAGEGVTIRVGVLDDGFFIEDDGPGIPAPERDRVFESGYSTREDGTGYGLSIVEQIASAHEWTIAVTEGSSEGARFEITGVEIVAE